MNWSYQQNIQFFKMFLSWKRFFRKNFGDKIGKKIILKCQRNDQVLAMNAIE